MSHSGRTSKHPYLLDSFWMNSSNWFWVGKNFTEASVKRFEAIVEDAITQNDRWQKPDSKNLWKR